MKSSSHNAEGYIWSEPTALSPAKKIFSIVTITDTKTGSFSNPDEIVVHYALLGSHDLSLFVGRALRVSH